MKLASANASAFSKSKGRLRRQRINVAGEKAQCVTDCNASGTCSPFAHDPQKYEIAARYLSAVKLSGNDSRAEGM